MNDGMRATRVAQLREGRSDFRVLVSPSSRTNRHLLGVENASDSLPHLDLARSVHRYADSCSSALRRATNASTADSMVAGTALMPIGRKSCGWSRGMCSATRSLRPMEAFVVSHQIQSQKWVLIAGRVSDRQGWPK
jgi:hypothetical protein